jgi:hypothetical protein
MKTEAEPISRADVEPDVEPGDTGVTTRSFRKPGLLAVGLVLISVVCLSSVLLLGFLLRGLNLHVESCTLPETAHLRQGVTRSEADSQLPGWERHLIASADHELAQKYPGYTVVRYTRTRWYMTNYMTVYYDRTGRAFIVQCDG